MKAHINSTAAKTLTPITIFIISFKPMNLTSPLWELTRRKLTIAANKTKGICFKNIEKSESILKLNLIK